MRLIHTMLALSLLVQLSQTQIAKAETSNGKKINSCMSFIFDDSRKLEDLNGIQCSGKDLQEASAQISILENEIQNIKLQIQHEKSNQTVIKAIEKTQMTLDFKYSSNLLEALSIASFLGIGVGAGFELYPRPLKDPKIGKKIQVASVIVLGMVAYSYYQNYVYDLKLDNLNKKVSLSFKKAEELDQLLTVLRYKLSLAKLNLRTISG